MKPTFENGGFWEYYKDLERQFQNYLEYVPYIQGNEDTYSFKLLSIILSIGGYIDSALKEMARFPEFSKDTKCKEITKRTKEHKGIIKSGVEAFNSIYDIGTKVVVYKCIPERVELKPFMFIDSNAPKWWEFYNELKHDVSINLEKANLENTRDALAAAFLLNVIHKPSILRLYDYNVLKFYKIVRGHPLKHVSKEIPRKIFEDMISKKEIFWGCIETELFRYDFNQK